MSVTVQEVLRQLQAFAPPELACAWDNVGLLVDAGRPVTAVLTALDITPPVVEEAAALGLEMLPATLEEAVEAAQNSPFLAKYLPEGLAQRYYQQQLRRCAELREAADPAEFERARYFSAI